MQKFQPRRGRPKDPDKRAAIMQAAKSLFLEQGYAGTSMNRIAELAGVSKLTLYSHYRHKENLFQQCVIAKCEEYTPDTLYAPDHEQPLRQQLCKLGLAFNRMLLSDEAINLYRMMAAEARQTGRLGPLFFAAGPQRTLEQFDALLAKAVRNGQLKVPNRRRAARHFFALLQGDHQIRAVLGEARPSPQELRAHVEDAVALFLRAYATQTGPEG